MRTSEFFDQWVTEWSRKKLLLDRITSKYEPVFRAYNPGFTIIKELKSEITSRQPCTMLDAGCGDGNYIVEIAQHASALVVGLDLSRFSIYLAKKSLEICVVGLGGRTYPGRCWEHAIPSICF